MSLKCPNLIKKRNKKKNEEVRSEKQQARIEEEASSRLRQNLNRESVEWKIKNEHSSRKWSSWNSQDFKFGTCGISWGSHEKYNRYPNFFIGKMEKRFGYCGANKFKRETQSICCLRGKVRVLPPKLFTSMTIQA